MEFLQNPSANLEEIKADSKFCAETNSRNGFYFYVLFFGRLSRVIDSLLQTRKELREMQLISCI